MSGPDAMEAARLHAAAEDALAWDGIQGGDDEDMLDRLIDAM